jgi:hypothetical protein
MSQIKNLVSTSSISQRIYMSKVYAYICNSLGVMTYVQDLFKEIRKALWDCIYRAQNLASINKHLIYWEKK